MNINRFLIFVFRVVFIFCIPFYASGQYFQQEVNYRIQVKLDDVRHSLHGDESFVYINNSHDTLHEIYMHLWPNAYKNRNTALFKQLLQKGKLKDYFTDEKNLGYIDSLDFKINGERTKWVLDADHIDICKIILSSPLKPGESITVSTPFFVKLPSASISRLGHIGQFYAISQWYPKPAVYDKKGWHAMPYLNQGEFYSEFGSFEVSITLPKNYVVASTGDLQSEEEKHFLDNRLADTRSISHFESSMDFPPSDKEYKTVTYRQDHVHDFAWFADKRFHVLKSAVVLPQSKETVTTWAFFTNSRADMWKKGPDYLNKAVYFYSLLNGDYPYKSCIAIDGTIAAGGGMEYPNITIINRPSSDIELEEVIVHEVGHNWFYGMLASNERDHPWMDEGINSFYEVRYLMQEYGYDTSQVKTMLATTGGAGAMAGFQDMNRLDLAYFEYLYSARQRTDQPISLPAEKYTEINYGTMLYAKAPLGFQMLKAYLGESLFDSCMKAYFETWKFTHPYPEDFRKIFSDITQKDLSWFFDDFLTTAKKTDYKISRLQRIYGDSFINPIVKGYALKIKNTGDIATPFSVSSIKRGKVQNTKWYEGFKGTDTINISCDQCDHVKIDAWNDIPDFNRKNNAFRTSGIFKGVEKISFPFLMRTENPDRTQISWLPIIAWNNYDKTLAGIALHNLSFVNKKLEYIIAPMYSFGQEDLAGNATLVYSMYPAGKTFQKISLKANALSYAYNLDNEGSESGDDSRLSYNKISEGLNFQLKNCDALSTFVNNIELRNINIWEEEVNYVQMGSSAYQALREEMYHYHNLLSYSIRNKRALDPYRGRLVMEQGKNYVKPSVEFVYRFSYNRKNRGVDVRFFTQGFLLNIGGENQVHLTGTGKGPAGSEDYLYDNAYFGRSDIDGIWSRQFYNQEGDFKIYSPIGRNDLWIGTINIKAHFPGILPLRAYIDLGMYDGSRRAYEDYKGITYDAGLSLCLWQDVLEIYFPLFHSTDIKKYMDTNDLKFKDGIRFVFNINAFDPFVFRESIISF